MHPTAADGAGESPLDTRLVLRAVTADDDEPGGARRYAELARSILDSLEAPTCVVDDRGVVTVVNQAWRQFMTDNGGSQDACGEGADYFRACAVPDEGAGQVARGLRAVLADGRGQFELEYECSSEHEQRWFVARVTAAQVDGGNGAVISHTDVTATREAERALTHQALHDHLTGLPNRLLLDDRVEQALLDAHRRDAHVALGFLDIDHFKRVNDSLGRAGGDALLVQVSERLRLCLRDGDTIVRYAGDEFLVLWRDLDGPDRVVELGDRVMTAFHAPFEVCGTRVQVAVSLGIAVAQPLQRPEDLLLAADTARLEAKRHGGGQVRRFCDDMQREARDQLAVEVDLCTALAEDQLVLHYQPVIDLDTGQPVGVEALARWQHPTRGLLLPDEFIGVAEASGLIVPLGAWALDQACRDIAQLPGTLDVAVNLSARQLASPEVVDQVRGALIQSGLDARRLVLEVTEWAIVADEEVAASTLDALIGLGVRIAIDDFGTGYSSLLYLHRYPVSALKIDRTFVDGLGSSRDDEAICQSVVSLAKAVDATYIAEGIETMEQYATLRTYGCQQAQGFLWSQAVPLSELPAVLGRCRQIPVPAATTRRRRADKAIVALEREVLDRIAEQYREGASLFTIAASLNRDAVANPTGARWSASSVARHLVVA